jgi:ribonuclease HI
MEEIEAVRFEANWESSMAVSIRSSKEEGVAADAEDHARWKVYTDGSGIDGRIGAAAVLYRDGIEVRTSRKRLGSAKKHTVFEGEGIGANLGMGLLWAEPDIDGDATIAIDSTAEIRATQGIKSQPSSYIWDKWHRHARVLQRKHPGIRLTFRWCPGHLNVAGNDRADEEANRAAQDGSSTSTSISPAFRGTLPWSRSAAKQAFNAALKLKVAEGWRKSARHHRVKRYDPSFPSAKFMKLTNSLPRKHAAILLQLRLGHTILNRHLHRINRVDSPLCPCCHQCDKTFIHYLLHCPAHANARAELHRKGGRDSCVLEKLLTKPKLLPLL